MANLSYKQEKPMIQEEYENDPDEDQELQD
jgi:hypothetical protein